MKYTDDERSKGIKITTFILLFFLFAGFFKSAVANPCDYYDVNCKFEIHHGDGRNIEYYKQQREAILAYYLSAIKYDGFELDTDLIDEYIFNKIDKNFKN